MPIMVKETGGGSFTPMPAGVHLVRCCDVVDLGLVESKFVDDKTGAPKKQHKVRVVWQASEADDSGKRLTISKQYTASLNEKATLRHDLESWRGRPFDGEELRGFDLERLIGVAAQVNVMHETNGQGKTYANVKAIMPLPKALAAGVPPVEGYTRVQDRPKDDAREPGADDDAPDSVPADDDSVPF